MTPTHTRDASHRASAFLAAAHEVVRALAVAVCLAAFAAVDLTAQHRTPLFESGVSGEPSAALDSEAGNTRTPSGAGTIAVANGRAASHAPTLALGGLAGGALGVVGGAIVGRGVELFAEQVGLVDQCGECFFTAGPFYGAALGEMVGIPLGVHLANGRRGSYWTGIAYSGLVGVIGTVALATAGVANELWLVVPAAQIYASTLAEVRTGRP